MIRIPQRNWLLRGLAAIALERAVAGSSNAAGNHPSADVVGSGAEEAIAEAQQLKLTEFSAE